MYVKTFLFYTEISFFAGSNYIQQLTTGWLMLFLRFRFECHPIFPNLRKPIDCCIHDWAFSWCCKNLSFSVYTNWWIFKKKNLRLTLQLFESVVAIIKMVQSSNVVRLDCGYLLVPYPLPWPATSSASSCGIVVIAWVQVFVYVVHIFFFLKV